MGERGVKLFGKLESPFVLRVELALKLKGVQYEYVYGPLPEVVARELKNNIVNEKDPVLIHNGKPIAESLVIIEYIDEIWKGTGLSILPADPYERAVARFLAKYADDKLMADIIGVYLKVGKEQKKSLELMKTKQRVLGNALKGKKFFGGDSIGYLDIVLGIIPYWIQAIKQVSDIKDDEVEDDAEVANLKVWSRNFLSLEIVKEKLPPFDKLIEMLKKAKGDYYRCHDVLEEIWNDAEEPVRTLIHGILQCAVGFYHLFNQNHRGAMMELGEGVCKLRKMDFLSSLFA